MKNSKLLFFIGLLLIFISSLFINFYFLPIDILNNFPTFNQGNWQKSKNSLLADPVFQFEPWRLYAKERIQKGEFPLWNNLNGMGSPFLANSQSAVLYPLQIFYYFLPTKAALFLIPVLKLYFYFWFIFLYLKIINCSGKISLFGAFVGISSAFSIVWLLWPHTNVFILLPLFFYFTEKIKKDKSKKNYLFLLVSISYCIGFFGGHPETLFIVFIAHSLYSILRLRFLKTLRYVFLSVLLGFILSSVQMIPFLEYLFNSSSLNERIEGNFLPLKSFVINFIPFIFGAPHQQFYKPIFGVNFQEAIGGYVGPVTLALSLWGVFKFYREPLFRIWGVIVLLCWALAYKIWPFWLVTFLPVLNKNANNRFVGVAAFGLAVLSSITLEQLFITKVKIKKIHFTLFTFISIIVSMLMYISIRLYSLNQQIQVKNFLVFLQLHLGVIFLSSWVFFLILLLILQKRFKRFFLILLIPLYFQTGFLLYAYNPSSSQYYPDNSFFTNLKSLPRGTILEVGNPNFPEDINIAYHIPHVQNYDALEVDWYKKKFDSLFPNINQWGNPNEVKLENLKKLGVTYVISDYDLNLIKVPYQSFYQKILSITRDKEYVVRFKPQFNSLKQIRILTANFNRINTCAVRVSLRSTEVISQTTFSCNEVRDFMYYTFDLPVNLDRNNEYELLFDSNNSSELNRIGLWTNSKGIPYLEFLYDVPNSEKKFVHLFGEKNVRVFKVPDVNIINMKGSYQNPSITPEHITFETDSINFEKVVINQTFFPGWRGTVDGIPVLIENENPFISLLVPSGKHIISISYNPYSFYIGILISFISWLSVIIYVLRKEKNTSRFMNFSQKWNRWAFNINKRVKWWEHVWVFFLGAIG